jgi:hypothetical protein
VHVAVRALTPRSDGALVCVSDDDALRALWAVAGAGASVECVRGIAQHHGVVCAHLSQHSHIQRDSVYVDRPRAAVSLPGVTSAGVAVMLPSTWLAAWLSALRGCGPAMAASCTLLRVVTTHAETAAVPGAEDDWHDDGCAVSCFIVAAHAHALGW